MKPHKHRWEQLTQQETWSGGYGYTLTVKMCLRCADVKTKLRWHDRGDRERWIAANESHR